MSAPLGSWSLLPPGAPLGQRLLVLALVLLGGALVWGRLKRGSRVLRARLAGPGRPHLPALRLGGLEFVSAARLVRWSRQGISLLTAGLGLVWFYFVAVLAFGLFERTRGVATQLLESLRQPLAQFGHALADYLPRGLVLILLVAGTRLVLGLVKSAFDGLASGESRREGFDQDWARPTYTLVRLGVLVFALVLAVPYLPGSGSEAFKAVSLFVGLLVSLGSSGTIGNLISGSVLTYLRAYRAGDVVSLGDHTGLVLERTLLVTRLRTFKDEEVILSNATILGGPVQNHSARLGRGGPLLHTAITIGYAVPWRDVHGLLLEAAGRTAHLEADPPPFVLQTALNDASITYELNATTLRPDRMPWIYSDLHGHIQDVFAAAGVEIMSAHYLQLRDGHDAVLPPGHGPHAPVPGFRLAGPGI